MESKRINKYISETGYCSRREADKLIESGCVTINGKLAESGSQVLPGQKVKVYGETIKGGFDSVILAYNKPVGVVSTTDPSDPDNIVNAIGYGERIFPIGRLDKDSQGLILMTNEGDLVNKILRVGNNHDKEYTVVVNKPINEAFIKGMQSGVPILGVVTRKCEITQVAACVFTMVLRQGLNRQIRRMCEYFGYQVEKLERTRIMHIKLGNLKQGKYRQLTAEEESVLRQKTDGSVKTEEASRSKQKQKVIKLAPVKLKTKTEIDRSASSDEPSIPLKKKSPLRKTVAKSTERSKTRNANKSSHKPTTPKSKTSGPRPGKSGKNRPDKSKPAPAKARRTRNER